MAPPNKQHVRTRPRLTLHEVTAIKLAVDAALHNTRAELSDATLGDLRGADAKLDRALLALAKPAPAPKSKPAGVSDGREQHSDHRQNGRHDARRPVRRKRGNKQADHAEQERD